VNRFLLDANLSPETAAFLTQTFGYDVASLLTLSRGTIPDKDVVAMAKDEDRVVITLDQDFGEIYHLRERGRIGASCSSWKIRRSNRLTPDRQFRELFGSVHCPSLKHSQEARCVEDLCFPMCLKYQKILVLRDQKPGSRDRCSGQERIVLGITRHSRDRTEINHGGLRKLVENVSHVTAGKSPKFSGELGPPQHLDHLANNGLRHDQLIAARVAKDEPPPDTMGIYQTADEDVRVENDAMDVARVGPGGHSAATRSARHEPL
jgi:hypothetical protein